MQIGVVADSGLCMRLQGGTRGILSALAAGRLDPLDPWLPEERTLRRLTGAERGRMVEAAKRAEHPLPWSIYSEPDVGLSPTIFSGTVCQSGFCPVDLDLAGNQHLIVTALATLKDISQ